MSSSGMNMTKRTARVAALLAMIVWSWIAPQPVLAQLLPPLPLPIGGSLMVSVTAPASGSTVSGTIPVNASVSIIGSLTVSRVDFYRDGNLIGSDSTMPYTVSWNTTSTNNGSHTLTAVARDPLTTWTSDPVTVVVANPPTVTINQAAAQADPSNASRINFTA